MNLGLYNKFWVGLAGFAITLIAGWTGINFGTFGVTPEAIVAFVTAILVYAVPNTGYAKAQREGDI